VYSFKESDHPIGCRRDEYEPEKQVPHPEGFGMTCAGSWQPRFDSKTIPQGVAF
jgi:hypothetical protein